MKPYLETFVESENLGKTYPPYQPTYSFSGNFINDRQLEISRSKVDGVKILYNQIKGSLRIADALKLYELAYFAEGNILELGCFEGLSTSIMAQARLDSGRKERGKIYTIDLSPKNVAVTRENLEKVKVAGEVEVIEGDAFQQTKNLVERGLQFAFAFIDHSHAYSHVLKISKILQDVVTPGGFCLFHDYNDRRNKAGDETYGVYQAVIDGLDSKQFQFYGTFGCTGLYRFTPGHAQAIGSFGTSIKDA